MTSLQVNILSEIIYESMRLLISVAIRAGQAGGGSFKREKNRKPKKDFAYRIVCDSLD